MAAKFRFGLFLFDAATQELRREDTLVHLQAQPAQVLTCLIERAGEVVSREELRQAVWGNDTFVDFERGLNFCIAQVRSALGDDAERPLYIRTLPKRGYQFIAPLEQIDQTPSQPPSPARPPNAASNPLQRRLLKLALALGMLAIPLLVAGFWWRSQQNVKPRPVVAVVRFDNETGKPEVTRFSDGLTDNLVVELTSQSNGRYGVIGNAQILRRPREQRDLTAIASSLHAGYLVLGQVQSIGSQTRILAHLIRMPDQTHIWVARIDRSLVDPPAVESDIAQKIATEFSSRVAAEAAGKPLPPFPSR